MSAYTTLADLQTVMPAEVMQRLATDATGGMSTEEVVDAKIEEASALIDSYLAAKTALPLLDIPLSVVWCCKELVRWSLYSRTGFAVNDDVQRGYDEAMKWLKGVASGTIIVGPPLDSSTASGGSYLRYEPRICTRDTMKGW